jgi:hypothetical protein
VANYTVPKAKAQGKAVYEKGETSEEHGVTKSVRPILIF